MNYYKRLLHKICFDNEFGRQMRFIAGPRQTGKTTLSKEFLKSLKSEENYYNWDKREIKILYRQNPDFFKHTIINKKKSWICFDEIHKLPKWKNILKDFFDSYEDKVNFIITGSARLDLFRKSGDSLVGRYFLFHLFPFNLRELTKNIKDDFFQPDITNFIKSIFSRNNYNQNSLEHLLKFSGFPEPLIKGSERFFQKWQNDYIDHVLNEDLRPLTRIPEIENIANLFFLLPDKIGSPLSINSLREDLEVSFAAAKNYIHALNLCYMIFKIKPYSKKINRTIKKEEKIYFYDWTRASNPGTQFENYVAVELLIMIKLWNDAGYDIFDLYYIRNRAGKETDFLITKKNKPWLMIEVKLKKSPIESYHQTFSRYLGNIPIIQIIKESNVKEAYKNNTYVVSAGLFFG